MNQNTFLLEQYTEKIIAELQQAGIAPEVIAQEIQRIDNEIQSHIAEELVNNLSETEMETLDKTNFEELNLTELGEKLSSSPEAVKIRYIQRVNEYVQHLPHRIKELKEQAAAPSTK